MDTGDRYFWIRRCQEDADDAPVFIARTRSTEPWQCEYCHHLNPANERSCQTCGHPRPEHSDPSDEETA